MRKTLKILGFVLGTLVILVVVAAIAAPLFIDPNDYKPRIEAAVEDATGRSFEIPGEIKLSVFPWLGAELGAVRLGNAAGFGEEPFAAVEAAQVRVKLLPLLSREVEVGRIVIEQPVIRLARNAEGVSNWDDLAGEAGEAETPQEKTAPPEFSVDGLEIKNAKIFYSDVASDVQAELQDFNLVAGRLDIPAAFPLQMSGSIRVSEPELAGTFEFEGHVSADPANEDYSLGEGSLAVDAAGKGLPVSPLNLRASWKQLAARMASGDAKVEGLRVEALGARLDANIQVTDLNEQPGARGEVTFGAEDLAAIITALGELAPKGLALSGPADGRVTFSYDEASGKASLSDARLNAAGINATATASAEGLPDAARATGKLDVATEDLGRTMAQLGTLAPDDLSVSGKGRISTNFRYDQAAGTAKISDLVVAALGMNISGDVDASNLNDAPAFKGSVEIAEFSPGQLLVRLGQELPQMRDGTVLDTASLTAKFEVSPNRALIDDLRATLDQSKLSGRVEVADIEKQALRFDLVLDQIDADRYLPPGETETAEEGEAPPLDQMEIPADLVRDRDIVGSIRIGKLKAFDFNSSDVNIGVTARNNKLRVHPAEAKFYGGGYAGDIRLDASGEAPVVSVDEHVNQVQLAPMVKDILDVENISGTAQMDVTATGRGKTFGALKKTLDGTFNMAVKDGAVEGFNLWESIREAYATLKGRNYNRGNAPNRTEFADLSASGRISKGILRNDDLTAKLPFLRVAGNGEIDIAKATMDYTIEATVLKSPELTGGIEELTGTAIPVRLTGPVMSPKVRPDVKGVLEAKAKEALDRKEQELRDEAKRKADEEKKRAEEKLKDKLKDIFN